MPFLPPDRAFARPDNPPQVSEENRLIAELLRNAPITGPLSQLSELLNFPGSNALIGGPMATIGPKALGTLLRNPRFKNPIPGSLAKGQDVIVRGVGPENAGTLFKNVRMGHRIKLLNGMDVTDEVIKLNQSSLPELIGPNATILPPELLGPSTR